MRINNNVMALNSHRQLGVNQSSNAKSMEKLSSGLRINRAGDDAAGLAISEKMRGQIRGLKQASRNAQDGISLIQTAEGGLNETHSILQRMRELAVQAATDTNHSEDRGQIQKEINQLTSEINRIGNTTEFNTQKLLRGAEKLEGLGSSILSAGVYQTSGGHTEPGTTAKVSVKTKGNDNTTGITPVVRVELSDGENVLTLEMAVRFDNSHTEEIIFEPKKLTGSYNISAYLLPEKKTAEQIATYLADGLGRIKEKFSLDALSIAADGDLLIIESTATGSDVSIKVSGTNQLLVKTSNTGRGTDDTPVNASAEIAFGELTKDQVLGKGITINNQTISFAEGATGILGGMTDFTVNVESVTDSASLVAAIADQLGNELEGVTLSASDSVLTVTATAIAEAGDGIVMSDGAALGGGANPNNKSLNLHIGANAGQAMVIDLADMRAANLGLTGKGAGFTIDPGVTNDTSSGLKESALDMSSNESADKAISVIDDAINIVSSERSKLGAYQNRLEHTIANLGTSVENLQAAESRVRDLDMSEEMMKFTKSNILNQAATAMLAQANMAPQSVLQLLG